MPRPTKESRRTMNPKKQWDAEEYLGFRPAPYDWAQLAAYIDGEGSINLCPRMTNTGHTLTLCGKVVIEHQRTTEPDAFDRGSGIKTPQNILSYRLELKRRLTELNRRGPKKEEVTESVMEA